MGGGGETGASKLKSLLRLASKGRSCTQVVTSPQAERRLAQGKQHRGDQKPLDCGK